jgi:PfaB family protein
VAFLRRGLAGPAADVRTPLGSFTSRAPLGATGGIAFVYPGAGSGYPGMGSGLFGLFPRLFALLEEREQNAAEALGGVAALFPPELGRLDAAALEALERSLAGDFHAQLNGTLFHSYVLTALAREVLGLRPARALGYCIGELAMFGAMGIWRDISQLNRRPPGLPVVRRRIFEDMEAVRDSWGLPPGAAPVPALWRTHVLFTTPAAAEAALREESQVYLVVVNTPGQVVVAGDAEGCARVIARLGCRAMPVPFNAPFHCDAIASERAMLTEWLRLATTADPGVTFHSLHATPLHQDEASIAAAISAMLTSRFDFPALIDQAYDAGARIFLELGARQLCSSWISESLGQRRHAAIPFDIKGADPAMALLRAMAQLVGHRVPCDISSLFGDTAELPSQI